MKTIGLTRRIDELGRIVIPKEIRKDMKLKPGELLEVYISDSDVLSMKKHEVLDPNDYMINTLINVLSKKLNTNVYLTNEDELTNANNVYNISPNGDKVCSLVVGDNIKDNELINFTISLLEAYYESK